MADAKYKPKKEWNKNNVTPESKPMSEFYKKLVENTKKSILKNGYSVQQFEVYCPYCAHEQCSTSVWESGLKPNDDCHEYECDSCEKEFIIKAIIKFSTEKI